MSNTFKNAVNWIEIPVSDFDRAKKFYSQIYNYDMPTQQMGAYMMGFLYMDAESQGVGGAIVHGDGYVPSKEGVLVYLNGGEDLNTILDRVEDAGGEVLMPKTQITPDIGYFATFLDTEGNKIALHSMS